MNKLRAEIDRLCDVVYQARLNQAINAGRRAASVK